MEAGLTPWRRRRVVLTFALPVPRSICIWSEHWRSLPEWLQSLESDIRLLQAVVVRGGDFDNWDLEVRSGSLAAVRMRATVEEHGGGRQLVRYRLSPRVSLTSVVLAVMFAWLSIAALLDHTWWLAGILAVPAVWLVGRMVYDSAVAVGIVVSQIRTTADTHAEQSQIREETYLAGTRQPATHQKQIPKLAGQV